MVTLNHRETFGSEFWNTPDHRAVGLAVLDACGDAGNRWIFPEQLGGDGLEPWGGVRWVAVAGSPQPTHAVEVGETAVERAVVSLSEHRAYLSGLSEEPVESHARSIVEWIVGMGAERFGGRNCVTFEVFPR